MTNHTELKLTISSEIQLLDVARTAFETFMQAIGIGNMDYVYWSWVGIQEALVNAIRHGNKEKEELPVVFHIKRLDNRMQFSITDRGPGVSLENIPDPTAPENLMRSNGRGFLFINNTMDRVLTRKGPDSFTLIMEKDFEGA